MPADTGRSRGEGIPCSPHDAQPRDGLGLTAVFIDTRRENVYHIKLVRRFLPSLLLLLLAAMAMPRPSEAEAVALPETPPLYVILEIIDSSGHSVTIVTRDGQMATMRNYEEGFYIGLKPIIIDALAGDVDISVVRLRSEAGGPTEAGLIDRLVGKNGFSSYLSREAILEVRVQAITAEPASFLPFAGCSQQDQSSLQELEGPCCVTCGSTSSCGCAVSSSCGSCTGC